MTRRPWDEFIPEEEKRAYRAAGFGRLDKGLDEARASGWTVVDMKADWKRVFPFEKE